MEEDDDGGGGGGFYDSEDKALEFAIARSHALIAERQKLPVSTTPPKTYSMTVQEWFRWYEGPCPRPRGYTCAPEQERCACGNQNTSGVLQTKK
jgi:hypothetical protein